MRYCFQVSVNRNGILVPVTWMENLGRVPWSLLLPAHRRCVGLWMTVPEDGHRDAERQSEEVGARVGRSYHGRQRRERGSTCDDVVMMIISVVNLSTAE